MSRIGSFKQDIDPVRGWHRTTERPERGAGVVAGDLRDLVIPSGRDQSDTLGQLQLEAAGAATEADQPGGARGIYSE